MKTWQILLLVVAGLLVAYLVLSRKSTVRGTGTVQPGSGNSVLSSALGAAGNLGAGLFNWLSSRNELESSRNELGAALNTNVDPFENMQ